jgi:carbon monoxide dehydrogenase subunit G
MIFEQQVTVAAPVEKVWAFLGDVRLMATCLPGLEEVTEENGDYRGALRITVGPISVRLEGRMRLAARDRDTWTTVLEIDAEDRRIRSSMRARTTMRLTPEGPDETQLAVHTDAAVLGKLGQMGQAVLRRKSDQELTQFIQNMAACLSQRA